VIVIWENTLAEPAIAKACARNMHVALAAGTMVHNLHPQVSDHCGGVHGASGGVLSGGFFLPATGWECCATDECLRLLSRSERFYGHSGESNGGDF